MSHLRRVETALQGQIQYRAILLVNFLAAVSEDRDLLQVSMNPGVQQDHYQHQEYKGGRIRVAHKQIRMVQTQNLFTKKTITHMHLPTGNWRPDLALRLIVRAASFFFKFACTQWLLV